MPLPKPNTGEKESEFIARCMGNSTMKADYSDDKQRLAVCYSQWRKAHGGKAADTKKSRVVTERVFTSTRFELRAVTAIDATGELPQGVCGRLTGIALTYNVADDYGTVFLPGCLAKTRGEKVATGKVKLFADHGPFTDTHVGVVRAMDDVGDAAVMTADLFDTDSGRQMKEYLGAVIASGADTGLSIGFRPIEKEWKADADGDMQCYFREIELRETSITPVPAVPGTTVTSVRREQVDEDDSEVEPTGTLLARALKSILVALPERDARAVYDAVYSAAPSTDAAAATATSETSSTDGTSSGEPAAAGARGELAVLATEADRLRAARMSFAP